MNVVRCLLLAFVFFAVACKSNKRDVDAAQFKGLYMLSPTQRAFKDCATGNAYWVADSTKHLETEYWELASNDERDGPVYIEVDGQIVPSNTEDADEAYTNTLIVRKVILITKDIPAGQCK
jgi:copper homeostasis protein (lipoprotein)